MRDSVAPVLLFACGNPSRGDDALGPAIIQEIRESGDRGLDGIEFQTDYQFQVEHALDLQGREQVLFVDASVSASEPFEYTRLVAMQDFSYTTHAVSPAAVLHIYKEITRDHPPPAYLLSIRGYEFSLGQPISPGARDNLAASILFVNKLLGNRQDSYWLDATIRAG
jgi:hydrogenase maturation protease